MKDTIDMTPKWSALILPMIEVLKNSILRLAKIADNLYKSLFRRRKGKTTNQDKIREQIAQIVSGNLRYADPRDKINIERGQELGVDGFTIQSADEVLADIILDLQSLEHELCLNGSMEGASL
jgi:hypothetical protein